MVLLQGAIDIVSGNESVIPAFGQFAPLAVKVRSR
jgi:hypothetical protein